MESQLPYLTSLWPQANLITALGINFFHLEDGNLPTPGVAVRIGGGNILEPSPAQDWKIRGDNAWRGTQKEVALAESLLCTGNYWAHHTFVAGSRALEFSNSQDYYS